MTIEAVTFDCYGTLVDWDTGVAAFVAEWRARTAAAFDTDSFIGAFADAQRRHQDMRPFKPYRRVLADSFVEAAKNHGIEATEADARAFAASAGGWPPFPDTVAALGKLAGTCVLGVMSNIDEESFAETHAALGGLIDEVVTADAVRSYKPGLSHFHAMFERLAARGIGRGNILHAAQSRYHDIEPARVLGLTSVWVDRRHGRPGRGITVAAEAEPDYRVTSLDELTALVSRLRSAPA